MFKKLIKVIMKKVISLFSYSLLSYVRKDSDENVLQKICDASKSSIRLIKTFKEKCGVPGIAVHININGKNHVDISLGYSDIENMIKCRPDSLMRIASISKSFTSIIAAKLIDEGLLDLYSDIETYNTSFPAKIIESNKATITCHHLLSHRSGIRHYNIKDNSTEYKSEEFLNRDRYTDTMSALKMFQNDDLIFTPGKKYLYSSYGYVLLSAVLEKVAENSNFFEMDRKKVKSQSLERMFDLLFQRLALNDTHCEFHEKVLPKRSRQYSRDCGKRCLLEVAPYVDNSCKWASGGLVSTCQDLCKFAEHLVKIWFGTINGIISQKSLRILWTPVVGNEKKGRDGVDESYGLGWSLKEKDNRFLVSHLGGASGGTSALLINLSQKVGSNDYVIVAILCNMESLSDNIGHLAEDITRLFVDDGV